MGVRRGGGGGCVKDGTILMSTMTDKTVVCYDCNAKSS